MNYRKKRMKAGISFYTMAKELGIPEDKYTEIELKKRPLEGDLIDKFTKVIENAKQIKFDRRIRLLNIDKWIKDGEARTALDSYGYNQNELAAELNVSPSTISNLLNGKSASDDDKEKVYDFLNNQLNKKITEKAINTDERLEFQKELKRLRLSQRQLAKEAGVSQVTISYLITGARQVSDKRKEKVYKALEKIKKQREMIEGIDLKDRMNKSSISTERLAKESDTSISTISRLITGNKGVSPKTTTAVFEALENLEKEMSEEENDTEEANIQEDVIDVVDIEEAEKNVEDYISEDESEPEVYNATILEETPTKAEVISITPVVDEVVEEKIDETEILKETISKLERQIYLYEKLIERL